MSEKKEVTPLKQDAVSNSATGIDSWLTPNGEVINVGKCNHNDYAIELLKEEFGKSYYDKTYGIRKTPYRILHERGWIRIKYHALPKIEILGDCIDLTKPMRNTIDPPMNEKQMIVAKELCEECNTTLHVAINDKRFW